MIHALLFFIALQSGPTATELLERGEKALADLEYDLAAEELMRAATAPDATAEQRLRAHLLAGTANRIAGHDVDAQINFRYVLTNAPATTLPEGTPPKVLTFFEAVRQQLQQESRPTPPPTPSPTPAPAPADGSASAPSAPAPATSSGGAFPLGLAVAGSGAAIAALGAVGLIGAEVYLMDPAADGGTRGAVQTLGVVSAGVLGVGVVAAAVGAGLWGTGALQ